MLVGRVSSYFLFFFLMIRRPPRSTPFPTRRSSDLASLGYEVAWIRPMPFEEDSSSLAPLVLMALTAARRTSSGEQEPVVVVVESPTAGQADAVHDQLLPPGVPEPFGPSVVLVVDGQHHRPRHTGLARVWVN